MTLNLNIKDEIYDACNYNSGVVIDIKENGTIIYRDEYYNQHTTNINYTYKVNKELSNKYGYIICDEHNEDIDYPYYIPHADENAYDFELEHFSVLDCYTY